MGVVSPIGNNVEENWQSLMEGKSGIGTIQGLDTEGFSVTIGGELKDFNPDSIFDKKEIKRYDDYIVYALWAAEEAVKMTGIDFDTIDKEQVGVIIGSGIGGFKTTENTYAAFMKGGPRKISPFFIPGSIINMASGVVSIRHGFKGPNMSIVTACASGTHSIGEAFKMIQRGDMEYGLAGGAEAAITHLALGGFSNMKALSKRNDEPEKASRPFDKDRDGFCYGRRCWYGLP